jgi:hypothetical protein
MDKKDLKQDKKMIAGAVHKHEKKLHPGKPMTKLGKGGVAKMHKGGKTNADMLSMGRGMAKVNDQKTGLKG